MTPRGKITLVLFFFSVCATVVLVHSYDVLRAEQLKPVELFDAVGQQLAACRSDDFPSAYQRASASVQARFPLERFSDMIRNDTARVVKSDRVEFGPWQRRDHCAVVEVFFIKKDGSVTPCIYSLVCEGDVWKIEGTRWRKTWKSGQQMRGIRS